MPDLADLCRNWWKQWIALLAAALLLTGVYLYLQPRQYLSTATAVAASAYNTDRAGMFNQQVLTLTSALGTPDDLDLVVGTGRLDTVYLAVTDAFNLYDHYKLPKDEAGRLRSAQKLRRNSRVMKSEYGELKVKVWDTDKNLAPQLANAILDKLNAMHSDLKATGNESAIASLLNAKSSLLRRSDSTASGSSIQTQAQLEQYDRLIAEYRLLTEKKPPALIVVERARSSFYADRPRSLQLLAAAAFLSLVFGLFLALVLESRKTKPL